MSDELGDNERDTSEVTGPDEGLPAAEADMEVPEADAQEQAIDAGPDEDELDRR